MMGTRRKADPVAAEPAPAQAAHDKPPMSDAECFKPSTFASRKAAAKPPPPARIVSLGKTEFVDRDRRTGEVIVRDAELFANIDKPVERWMEIDGVPGRTELFASSGKENKVTPLPGRIRLRGRGPHPDTPPAPPETRRPV